MLPACFAFHEDYPGQACSGNADCFSAQGEVCNLETGECELEPDAMPAIDAAPVPDAPPTPDAGIVDAQVNDAQVNDATVSDARVNDAMP